MSQQLTIEPLGATIDVEDGQTILDAAARLRAAKQATADLPPVGDFAATVMEARQKDAGPLELTFSASSDAPLDRYYGTEILSHAEGAVRMDRINGGSAPLLFNHDWNDPIGMIDGARIVDGRLMVNAHLFATERAQEIRRKEPSLVALLDNHADARLDRSVSAPGGLQ